MNPKDLLHELLEQDNNQQREDITNVDELIGEPVLFTGEFDI
jgi:hypothetical protein